VITDASPYDLPPNAFSAANNVIFSEGRIQRAPVFKQLFNPIRSTLSYDAATGSYDANSALYNSAEGGSSNASRFVGSYTDPIAGETVFVADNDGTIRAYPGNAMSFQTPSTGTVTNDNPWTHSQVAGLSFLARKGMRPYVRNIKNDSQYSLIAGDWVATDTASVVRGFKGYSVMLGINKNGVDYPTMVKWSNPIQYSSAISTVVWDPANTNYVAGENVIGDMKNPIRDGMPLGEAFVIYSQNQLWLMEYSGDVNVFNFRRLPFEGGVVNTNCVVEVESKHFVFGDNDIYVHDGMSRQSIADGRVRRRIFNTLDRSKQNYCFVSHDSVSKLLHFCYATLQREASFSGTAFCNQAATYNYKNDTWTFMDLPNIVGGAEANATLVKNSFPDVTNSYSLFNTAYTSFSGGGTPKLSIMLGVFDQSKGLSDSCVYAIDLPTVGLVNLPANVETLKPAYVERVGVSLDAQGLPLRSYKTVQNAVPEASFDDSTGTFTFEFGSSDLAEQTPNYRSKAVFNPSTDYKIDMMVSGRYLAYKVSTSSISNFQLSGMDCEIKSLSRR
jgi:hypothetical protein